MKKKLQNLERLCKKMQARFGEQDELVLELKQELATLQEKKLKYFDSANVSLSSADIALVVSSAIQ